MNSRLLSNYIVNASQCCLPALYTTLAITNGYETDQETQDAPHIIIIIGTLLDHNGALDHNDCESFNFGAIPPCALCSSVESQHEVLYLIENSTISSTYSVGSVLSANSSLVVDIQLTNFILSNNHDGALVVRTHDIAISNPPTSGHGQVNILINSSTISHNINGSLKLNVDADRTQVKIYGLTIVGNTGTFRGNTLTNMGAKQGINSIEIHGVVSTNLETNV